MGEVKRAVIVGVNEYQDKKIRALKGAEQDALEVKDILKQHGDFTVDEKRHFLLGPDATHEAVLSAISDLFWKTDPSALAVFYFSGHGIKDSYEKGYLFPWDMEMDRPLVHGIEMQSLRELALQSKHNQAVVIILDCCYAGVAADASAKGSIHALDTAATCFSGIAEIEPSKVVKKGVFVFSSSAENESSRELLSCQHKLGKEDIHPHGAFTFHLLEGLSGLAVSENEEAISLAALRNWIEQASGGGQTFEHFASQSMHPEKIILSNATDVVELSAKLETVKKHLAETYLPPSGSPGKECNFKRLLTAAALLSSVIKDRPNYQAAKDLQEEIEKNLLPCRSQTLLYLQDNMLDLLARAPRVCDTLHKVVRDLDFERIGLLKGSQKRVMGALLTLVDAVQKRSAVEELLPDLEAWEAEAETAQAEVPPPPTQSQRGIGA
jgi:hypothetical protein